MGTVFLKLLNMSITAGWLILAVVLLRPLFRRAPKWIRCVLWAMVAVRLVCPFSLESVMSLIPSTETVSAAPSSPNSAYTGGQIVIQSGIPIVDNTVNPILGEVLPSAPTNNNTDPWQIATEVAGYVWVVGVIALALYACISYLRLRRKVRASLCKGNRVFVCDEISSPFILGIFKPSIYLPSGMDAQTASYVLAHEQAHLRRRDHWWKPFGYLLLTVYWFHPLVWLAYILLCRDIELACDEKVIRDLEKEEKAAYSQALLDCSGPRRLITVCPLAFGEVGVKERVKKVLHYKRPAFWILLVAVVACVVTAVCLLTDPKEKPEEPAVEDYRDDGIYEDGNLYIANAIAIPETPPFPLPDFQPDRIVYRNRSILHTYVNVTEQAREEYYQTMREEGFYVETFDQQSFLFRDGCAVFLTYYEKTDGSVSAQCTYYVQREDVSAEELTPEQAKAIIGGDHPYDPIDVSPEKLYEHTGGQIFMQVELVNGHPSSFPRFYFVTESSIQRLFDAPIAWADVDRNGSYELWTMTSTPNNPNSSSLYHGITAYENNVEKATASIRYGLNRFAAHEGKLCLQTGSSKEGEPILYEISISNGKTQLTRILLNEETTKGEEENQSEALVEDDRKDEIYDGENLFISNAIEIPETPPFPLPDFQLSRTVYSNSYITRTYVNVTEQAREEYYQTMREEGFSVVHSEYIAQVSSDDCAVFLRYHEEKEGTFSMELSYLVQREKLSESALTPEQALAVIGNDLLEHPIDVTPSLLFEKTGGQLFYTEHALKYEQHLFFVTPDYAIPLSHPSIAWTDPDGNGTHELWTFGPGPTSGVISYSVSAYENGKEKYASIFTDNRFWTTFVAKNGRLCINTTDTILDGIGEIFPYEIEVRNGDICILKDGLYLEGWNPQADEKDPLTTLLVSCLRSELPGLAMGLMDLNFDGLPEVLAFGAGGSMLNVCTEVYDLKSGEKLAWFDLPRRGDEVVELCVYRNKTDGSYVTLTQGAYSAGVYGKIFVVDQIEKDGTLSSVFNYQDSFEIYRYRGTEVTKEEYDAYYEQFWDGYERLEATKLQAVLWSTFEDDYTSNDQTMAQQMAEALLGSDQSFVTVSTVP